MKLFWKIVHLSQLKSLEIIKHHCDYLKTNKQTNKKHLEPRMVDVKSSVLRTWFGEVAHTRRYGKDLFLVENYYLESKIIRSILHDQETKTSSGWCYVFLTESVWMIIPKETWWGSPSVEVFLCPGQFYMSDLNAHLLLCLFSFGAHQLTLTFMYHIFFLKSC